jgi:predicted AAA+ superfamily ATPase
VNIADRLGAWARTEAQLAEIHSLNDRAHKGDADAMAALEQMMREFAQQQQARQQQETEPSSVPIDPQLM